MPSVIKLSVVMLRDVMPSGILLSVVMPSVVMPCAIILIIVMQCRYTTVPYCCYIYAILYPWIVMPVLILYKLNISNTI
jgi:hypothetical protein